ncbi:E4 [Gammapapillomavirus 22]|uniref:E4 protein n=1 Tax=Human papillomavirus TaxID=10566 RepID=A0A385PHX0_9PAPI|nr:E4 [Gammapapillomavirus 22]AYA93535.1 MAG: E4 protein [Human papillomavirus]
MPLHMVLLDNGLYIIKMKLFLILPLLALHKNRSSDFLKGHQGDTSLPPGTPFPLKRVPDEKKTKREELARPPPRTRYEVDDDENKENLPPERNDDECKKSLVQYLLDKWAEDITWYQQEVLHDLNDLQKKLGIPQSY